MGAILARFTMPGNPFRVVVSRDAARAYAISSSENLLVVDLAGRRAVRSVSTGLYATNGLVESRDGATLFVSSMTGGIVAIDLATGGVANVRLRGWSASGSRAVAGCAELYVADETGGVIAMRTRDGTLRRLATQPSFGLALTLDGSQLWVTQPAFGRILVVDPAQLLPIRTIVLGAGTAPRRIAFDQSGQAAVSDESGFVHIFPSRGVARRLAPPPTRVHFSLLARATPCGALSRARLSPSRPLDDDSYSLSRPTLDGPRPASPPPGLRSRTRCAPWPSPGQPLAVAFSSIRAAISNRRLSGPGLRRTGTQGRAGHPAMEPIPVRRLPYIAAMHGDIFYPTALLRLLLPADLGMTWGFMIHVFLCGCFTYGFCAPGDSASSRRSSAASRTC